MARIAGIARGNARSIVEQMLEKIAYNDLAWREIIETRNATLGIVYSDYEKPFIYCLQKQSTVRDSMGVHFAQAQAADKALRLMRDAAGVAPLYYGKTNRDEWCFASEVKALMTVTCDINEFPPGYLFDGKEMNSWSVFREDKLHNDSAHIIVGQLREMLQAAIIESIYDTAGDIGVLLSGGLDSTAIATLASKFLNSRIHTFTIGLHNAPDLVAAREVADYLGTTHHSLIVSRDELIEYLPEVIWHLESFDALLVRSSVLHYLIAKKASDYVPIIMVGEGADELFAGYPIHLVTFSLGIPPDLKIRNGFSKWCLREAMADMIPASILHRPRAKFWNSGGVDEILAEWARESISLEEYTKEQNLPYGWRLDSREELLYYRIFHEHFGEIAEDPTWIGRTIGAPIEKQKQVLNQSISSGF